MLYDDRMLLIDDCPETTTVMLSLLERGATREELREAWGLDEDGFDKLLELLLHLRMVVPATESCWSGTEVERQVLWLAAHGRDGNEDQKRLRSSHVAIWGIGGVGSAVLQHLAGAGLGHLTLIDYDRVCRHNFNRQYIFTAEQVGMSKLDAAVAWLGRTYDAVRVKTHARKISSAADLVELHLQAGEPWSCLVIAADEPVGSVHEIAAEFSVTAEIPVIAGSCGFRLGTWGPLLLPADVPRWQAWIATEESRWALPPAPRPMAASFGPTNGLIGSLLASDVIAYVAGLSPVSAGKLMTIDFTSLRISALALPELEGAAT